MVALDGTRPWTIRSEMSGFFCEATTADAHHISIDDQGDDAEGDGLRCKSRGDGYCRFHHLNEKTKLLGRSLDMHSKLPGSGPSRVRPV